MKEKEPLKCQYPITKRSKEPECTEEAKYHDTWGWVWCDEHSRDEEGNLKTNMYKLGTA